MKTLNRSAALAIGSVACLMAAPASAVPLDALGTGVASVFVNVLDMGTTTYPTAPATVCSTVLGCNTASGGSVGDLYTTGEDTWGVMRITTITVGTNTWNAGDGGQYLTGMFYNGFDQQVSYDAGTGVFTATGLANSLKLDLYVWNTDINLNAYTSFSGDRTGVSSYSSVAGAFTGNPANLWLSLVFDDFTSEFKCLTAACTSVAADTQGHMSVTGGSSAINYDTNQVINSGGGISDFFLTGSPGCVTHPVSGVTSCGTWTSTGNLAAYGSRIPEPGSMALAGLGLIGLAALRRRKQA